MLAAEAVMAGLADHFGADRDKWALAGLLHDVDYDETKDDPEAHGLVSARILSEKGIDPEIIHAVKAHADKAPRVSLMDKALYCTDPLTGFLVACALLVKEPEPRRLSSVDVEFALRRFKEKAFARGAGREQMLACKELGLSLDTFIAIGLSSMIAVADELGL